MYIRSLYKILIFLVFVIGFGCGEPRQGQLKEKVLIDISFFKEGKTDTIVGIELKIDDEIVFRKDSLSNYDTTHYYLLPGKHEVEAMTTNKTLKTKRVIDIDNDIEEYKLWVRFIYYPQGDTNKRALKTINIDFYNSSQLLPE